ncbi:MAG: Ig-like domain-containing protein [candidate division Zixibacteria bacterium]
MFRRGLTILISVTVLFAGCSDKTTEPGDPTPIRITSPTNNSTLSEPATIVAAAGEGYALDRVDFYVDGDSVWTDFYSPYGYYWNVYVYSSNTQHTLFAIGYTADSSYTSALINVDVAFTSGFAFLSVYVPSSQACYGVVNYQNVMFAATGPDGLELIDISDKASPDYISRYDSPGQAIKSDVSFPYVFIADMSEGVTRADFSDPYLPVQRGAYTSQGSVNDVAVSENYLFVAENDGVSVVGYSNPDNMNFISKVSMADQDQPQFVVARGDTAFVAAIDKFYIIDFTIPASPLIISTFATPGQAKGVAVDGNLAFIADGPEGVIALSIADPTSPVEAGRYTTGQNFSTVDVSNYTLFAGALSGGVYALDYSQPDTLTFAHQFDTGDMVWQVHSDPPYLYIATSGNVNILRYFR